MTAREKQPSRPEASEEPSPAPPQEPPESVAPRTAPVSETRGAWSPADYADLVIAWSVEDENVPHGPRFPVAITLADARRGVAGAPSEIVRTLLSRDADTVPFSVRDETGRTPFLAGEVRYEAEPDTARLVVRNLRYPGGSVARHVLFPRPSVP